MKPKLKAPGTKRLTLKCDEPLSNFAFKFNLRRYIKSNTAESGGAVAVTCATDAFADGYAPCPTFVLDDSDLKVGWCRYTLSNPS